MDKYLHTTARSPALVTLASLLLMSALRPAWAEPSPQPSPTISASEAGAATPADDKEPQAPSARPGVGRTILATAAAIGPGFLYHGLGPHILGDTRTARRMLIIEGITFGSVLGGAILLGATGAPGEISRPLIPLLLGLSGGMLINWVAGIYGAVGAERVGGRPRLDAPRLMAQLSYVYIDDPQFTYSHFGNIAIDARHRRWRGRIDAQISANDDNRRVRAGLGYRLYGPIQRTGGAPLANSDGSFLEFEIGAIDHEFGADLFRRRSYELLASGRYDLARVSPVLAGAFGEVAIGVALDTVDYRLPGVDADLASQPVGGFAFGMYLGRPERRYGQVRLFYDHTRAGFVGSLATPGGGNGFVGSWGLDGQFFFTRRVGAIARAHAGSAYLFDVGLLFQL